MNGPYDLMKMEIGKCGRCNAKIKSQYLWCDDCEDTVLRVSPTIWKDYNLSTSAEELKQ